MHGKLDLNMFAVLRAVFDHGSITKAANALHITQPAVSLAFEVPPLPVHMYWHKHADDDLVNLWMREKLPEVATKMGL
ncbi:MAG: LysR family transcriptional regulator [Alteromonas sp.]|jgi:regulatory helix-turn-helix LysR family protein|nr:MULTISPECIES: LysR family transcriptional regulator [Alteromonas]MBR9895152.1 LysR family transcriptional regulator [Gammaproteobacteria bacterium]NQY18277.1 LysR family transcriptional regulator [Alteromonas sp.]|tara:strand:+ start:4423 stop:4656 length:234 start_codon:yes stop_codon:yes gene_type:complete